VWTVRQQPDQAQAVGVSERLEELEQCVVAGDGCIHFDIYRNDSTPATR
jgi:quinol monooxygenase YgiN